jgi:hypothetical protein
MLANSFWTVSMYSQRKFWDRRMGERDRHMRLMRIAYLHLSESKGEPAVRAILFDRGATEEEALVAINTARRHLGELAAYRNRELLKYVAGGLALIAVGYLLIPDAADAAGRFRGMPYTIMLLGLATIAFGIWSRQLPR